MTDTPLTRSVNRFPDYDQDALHVEQAQKIIRDYVMPIDESGLVDIRSALGRVLATDIISPIDVPAHDNAAMDGYAFRSSDLADNASLTLKIIGSAYAGASYSGEVRTGECVRIMTGAVMPSGCDTVIPQELVQNPSVSSIMIPACTVKAGDNRRLAGEDLSVGTAALRKGKLLRPADIGLLASIGIGQLSVQRRLRIAIFSTGNELRSIDAPLENGYVYDSNRYTLHGMLTRLGCDIIDMGIVKDDPVSLEGILRRACEQADVIITSGGVSVGEADYTKKLLEKMGDVTFWKINMRPGKPMAFGTISSNRKAAYLFALPGNPVAVMVSFYFFVRDALLRMMGAQCEPLPMIRAASQSAIRKKKGRTEFQRGVLFTDAQGNPSVRLTGAQGSGILRSMSEANCIIVLHPAQTNIASGEMVDVVVFEGLI